MAKTDGAQRITTVILAAKLAKEVLELVTMEYADLAKLQFRQIVIDMKALHEHIEKLGANG